MSQWANEHPEEMAEIARLPLSEQNEALRGAMGGGFFDAVDRARQEQKDGLSPTRRTPTEKITHADGSVTIQAADPNPPSPGPGSGLSLAAKRLLEQHCEGLAPNAEYTVFDRELSGAPGGVVGSCCEVCDFGLTGWDRDTGLAVDFHTDEHGNITDASERTAYWCRGCGCPVEAEQVEALRRQGR